MNALDRVIPAPALVELDEVELDVPPAAAWELVRHADLGESALLRALLAVSRSHERTKPTHPLRIDALRSSPEAPGFQLLVELPQRELVVGAIGKVWHLEIPFVHVRDADEFRAFDTPGFVKVAWAFHLAPHGDHGTLVTLELRVDATDADAWSKFRRYYTLVEPGARFVQRAVLASLAHRGGAATRHEEDRRLAGDDLLPDAAEQATLAVTMNATPERIWPWLVQMGRGRAGFYGVDSLDNEGDRSAREIHPDLQRLRVGDVIPTTPDGYNGFEVLQLLPHHALVLGSLYDADEKKQRSFDSVRPEHFWQTTWAFVLEPLDGRTTRLHVRARAAFPASGRVHATWIRPAHRLMQATQLRHLAARVEGTLAKDDVRDIFEGAGGAAVIAAAFLTPFLRERRNRWGVEPELASRTFPGDELVASPRWAWTHGIEIAATSAEVWPWVAQLGADRGGFYSYQWLENLAGCDLRNAEAPHAEWTIREGDTLSLHPRMPPLHVTAIEPGRFFVVSIPADEAARDGGRPWAAMSWLFLLEPLPENRTRFISRFRVATSDDLATRLRFGATVMEPVGFAMDRRMLLGVKERIEGDRSKQRRLRNVKRRSSGGRTPTS